jgi:hypothetical protein
MVAQSFNTPRQPVDEMFGSMLIKVIAQQFPLSVSMSTVFWPFGHPLCSTAGLSTITSSKIARS